MVSREQSSSSSMARHLALGSGGFCWVWPLRSTRGTGALADRPGCLGAWLSPGLLDRSRDPAQRRAEVGQIDHGQQQPDHPEQMDVGKERQQAQHRHDFELQLLRLVRHLLRQGVQPQIKIAYPQNGNEQNDAHNHHQGVGVTGSGDEAWQIVGGAWMKGLAHATLHSVVSLSNRTSLPAFQTAYQRGADGIACGDIRCRAMTDCGYRRSLERSSVIFKKALFSSGTRCPLPYAKFAAGQAGH